MRNRRNEAIDISLSSDEDEEEKAKYPRHDFPSSFGIMFLICLCSLVGLIVFVDNRLPSPLYRSDEVHHPEKFIAHRAQEDLKYLTDLGPRVVGSYENEVITLAFLKNKITDIIRDANPNQRIELDVQVSSGSYFLDTKPTGRINIYANVQNVVAKLHGKDSNNTLLVNSHFDTVPTSPGGGDAGINCAVMLELLRKLSKRSTRLQYSVVFLFNGAEESGLQGSHAFISNHKWAAESKVLINLEAGGTGGKAILFQTGPNRPWLTLDYSSVPHPKAQCLLEELFQANVIPSDDDFRVFRDFGDMVGLDFAFFKDSYRYHNKFDGFENIPLGSFQHLGDNVLKLIEKIANNPELTNDDPKIGKMIYFDFLGYFFINYTTQTALVLNIVASILSLLTFIFSLRRLSFGMNVKTLVYLLRIVAATFCGIFTTVLYVLIQAYFLDWSGYAMRWYRHSWYCVLNSVEMATLANSSNIIRLPLVKTQAADFIGHDDVLQIRDTKCPEMFPLWSWKIINIIFSLIPLIINIESSAEVLGFFIPLSGRIGNFKMPDIVIGLGTCVAGLLVLTPYFFLVFSLRNPSRFYKIILCFFVINLCIIFTPLRFPYSGDINSPTPQRFWILHSSRLIHDENGKTTHNDTGYFFMNMDRNSPKSVEDYVDDLKNAVDIGRYCEMYLMCGLPVAHPKMSDFIEYSTWIPASDPPNLPEPEVDIVVNAKTRISSNSIRYNLTIHGTDHTMFFLSPKKDFKIAHMNFLSEIPNGRTWNGRHFYFFVYTCGKKIDPLYAIFDIEGPDNFEGSTIDIGIAGNYVHTRLIAYSPSFEEFLSKFPEWVDLTTWVAVYKSWII